MEITRFDLLCILEQFLDYDEQYDIDGNYKRVEFVNELKRKITIDMDNIIIIGIKD